MIFQNFGYNQNYPVGVAPAPAPALARLAISQSLWSYFDFAFTESYSGSGQVPVYDLSGNNNHGVVSGSLSYKSITSGSLATTASFCLMQGGATDLNNVSMPTLTLPNEWSMVCSYYIKDVLYAFNFTEIFVARQPDPEAYGILGMNATNSFRAVVANNDNFDTTKLPVNSASGSTWHVTQMSFNDSTNLFTWSTDGVTGSFTHPSAISTGIVTPRWNNGGNNTGFDPYLGSGSMVQVMAVYTGSLSTDQMLSNWNSLRGRYDL
jgi:hypothetical protein